MSLRRGSKLRNKNVKFVRHHNPNVRLGERVKAQGQKCNFVRHHKPNVRFAHYSTKFLANSAQFITRNGTSIFFFSPSLFTYFLCFHSNRIVEIAVFLFLYFPFPPSLDPNAILGFYKNENRCDFGID